MAQRPRDSQQSKVWNAEHFAGLEIGKREPAYASELSRPEAQAYALRVLRSAWWKKRAPQFHSVMVQHSVPRSCLHHVGGRNGRPTGEIYIAPSEKSTRLDVLHLLAHYIAPADKAWHGPEFCRTYLEITSRFLGVESKKILDHYFRQEKVKSRVWSEEAKEGARNRAAARDLHALLKELS